MKKYFKILFFLTILTYAQNKIEIWPAGQMPNTKGNPTERIEENDRVKQLYQPELYEFSIHNSNSNTPIVLIIPGGGYQHITYKLYGFEFAEWLNKNGIDAFVLNYRLPTSNDLIEPHLAPLQDAQMAIKYIKNLNTMASKKIGVLGVSAGGHLVAQLSNSPDITLLQNDLKFIDPKPDYAILVSPVIDFKTYKHEGSVKNLLNDKRNAKKMKQFSMQNSVSKHTPPSLLIHAIDDQSVPYQNSILYFNQLIKYQVKSSLYLLPFGNHNLNLCNTENKADSWKDIVIDWIYLNHK
jgi:Esterase/lipase